MEHQLIIDSLNKHINLSSQEQKCLMDKLLIKKIKKKQFFLHEKQIAKETAYVLNGCLRSYSIDNNGFEHVLQFAPQGWWITDMYSFISQKEGYLNIDALEDTEVLLLTRESQLALFDHLPQLERYFRILTEKALVSNQQRLMDNLSLTAKQRYRNFCKTYPTLINVLPQKQIASYIGVTPEFLSKMRSNLKSE
ncbi:MAG: Crp/Fnr family transcriptional regulator, partial [Bacteroidia bacterium]